MALATFLFHPPLGASLQLQWTIRKGLHPEGGGMINRSPPSFAIEGGLYPGQSGMHTTLPWVKPTPPWLPVPLWVQLKFPRVINPDSPLNDSRQLEWRGPKRQTCSHKKGPGNLVDGRLYFIYLYWIYTANNWGVYE